MLVVKRLGTAQAVKKLAKREAGERVLPFGHDLRCRTKHEAAIPHRRVRDGKLGIIGNPNTARPEDDVQIERPRSPALAAAMAAAEMVFDVLKQLEELRRRQVSREDSGRVGITAARCADGQAGNRWRDGKHVGFDGFKRGNGLFDDPLGPADQRMPLVRAERDQVEIIAQISSTNRP